MPTGEHPAIEQNPLLLKVNERVTAFLGERQGETVNDELIAGLSELILATTTEVVSVKEAALMLGVSQQRVSYLQNKGKMPAPLVHKYNVTTYWLKEDIEAYSKVRPTKPGRRPTHLLATSPTEPES